MPKFISDEEMAALEGNGKPKKRFISDKEMAALASQEESEFSGAKPSPTTGILEALGIPGRAVLAAIRSGQEAVGGNPSKPWESVIGGGRDLALDVLRAPMSPSGSPPQNQMDASTLEKIVSFALGTATDPAMYIPGEQVGKGVGLIGKGAKAAELKAAKMAGAIAEPLTVGRITSAGMEHAVKDFSPLEQIMAKSTLEDVGKSYGPLRKEASQIAIGKKGVEDASFGINPVEVNDKLKSAIDDLEGAYSNLKRQLSPSAKVGNVPNADVGAPMLQSLMGKLDEIKGAGKVDAIQAAEINDMLNQLKMTPLGNPRAVPGNFKAAYSGLQKEMADALTKSAPELGEGRAKFHAASQMNLGRAGGKMTEMFRQADINAAIRDALGGLASGDAGIVASAIKGVLIKTGPAWNAAVGAARIPTTILSKGADAVANFMIKNPEAGKAALLALHTLGKGEAQGGEEMPPPVAPPMPPQPPPPSPQDQALMDLTGLHSVMNGKIQDPQEVAKFVDDVEHNAHLTSRQKMIIQIKAKKDGTITLPQSLQ